MNSKISNWKHFLLL